MLNNQHMKKFVFIAMLCILFSCKGKKAATDANVSEVNTTTISSSNYFVVEKIAKTNSREALLKNYPNANIKEGEGMFDEGTVKRAYTILYPNTKNEIHLIWDSPERKKLYQVYFSNEGDWKSEKAIAIGTTYDELVARNGKPIKVYGFGWDYSGAVDWNGGKLENSKLQIYLTPAKEPKPKFYGDGIINPTEQELKELNLTVGQIIYHLGNE
jgi:hypothetical protein